MGTFRELYNRLVDAALRKELDKEVREIMASGEYKPEEVDRLVNPMAHPVVMRVSDCQCPSGEDRDNCAVACLFSAIERDENG
ncbi:MAG TPA: iron hydrogenase, partial [Thermoclostridium caenicola]|nr:iron hydrogenase [Thermoclostridium caenicola]